MSENRKYIQYEELQANIWDLHDAGEVVCILTNGRVMNERKSQAIVGRNMTQALQRYPNLPGILGYKLRQRRNTTQMIRPRLIAFQTRPKEGISTGKNVIWHMRSSFPRGSSVPGWAMIDDLEIIKKSLERLSWVYRAGKRIYLPRPGCDIDGPNWENEVKPLCRGYIGWLVVVSKPT